MARSGNGKLTELESVIMDGVWELGGATVRQVREHLADARPMAYNTVLTMMRILHDKGFLDRERVGRSDVYSPAVSREQMGRRSLRDVLERFFSGSARAMVSQLLASEDLSAAEIKAIRTEVDGKLRGKKSRGGTL